MAVDPAGRRKGNALWCFLAAVLSGALHLIAFPPFDAAAAAYVFALPLLLLCMSRRLPRARIFGSAVFVGFWLSWTFILIWLRHISPPWGMLGAVALAAVLAVFPLLWFMAARHVVPLLGGLGLVRRVVLLFALAGFWVVLEWVRGWLFTGFPWLPLSASQWQLPVMLQPAAWTGHYGISFVLIYFNLAVLQYLRNWSVRFMHNPLAPQQAEPPRSADEEDGWDAAHGADTPQTTSTPHGAGTPRHTGSPHGADLPHGAGAEERAGGGAGFGDLSGAQSGANADSGAGKPPAEERWRRDTHFSGRPSMGGGLFGGADAGGTAGGGRIKVRVCPEFYLALLFIMGSILLYQRTLQQMRERAPMFAAAVVQPWIPASIKWEPGQARATLDILYNLSMEATTLTPKPDVMVWPETAPPFALLSDESPWMEQWTDGLVRQTGLPLLTGALARFNGELFNGLFYVSPRTGVEADYYAKRRLVPFGEYKPLKSLLPFMDKVVPLPTDISAGQGPTLLKTEIGGRPWWIGSLICYEDIFGSLGRANVLAGADMLLVVTNDAWYGQDAGAYQHAAHSVLRAVEARRPLLRAGNHGWSGWIDEAGIVRAVFAEADGNVYQRGVTSFEMVRSVYWVGRPSFYVSRGDWFVGLSGVFALWGLLSVVLPARRRRSRAA